MSSEFVPESRSGASAAGSTARLVIFCGGWPWDGPRGAHRQIAQELSSHATVLYIEPPRSPLTSLNRRLRSGDRMTAGAVFPKPWVQWESATLARMTPLAPPGKERRGVRPLTDRTMRYWIRRAARSMNMPVHAVISGTLAPVLDLWPDSLNVMYATDDYVAGASLMGVDQDRLQRAEAACARHADIVIACSEVLVDKWTQMGVRSELVANGVDADLFATTRTVTPAVEVDLPHPMAGVMGRLSERIDPALINAVCDNGWSVLLVGSRPGNSDDSSMERLIQRPEVQWVGPRPFEDLPRFLAHMDVGLVPYYDNEFNRASFPLKALEYLAAGLPVVSTALPAIDWLGTDLISTSQTVAGFADAVSSFAPPNPPAAAEARLAFARHHDWSSRAATVARYLGLT